MIVEATLISLVLLVVIIILSSLPLYFAVSILGGKVSIIRAFGVMVLVGLVSFILSLFFPVIGTLLAFLASIWIFREFFKLRWIKAFLVWIIWIAFIFLFSVLFTFLFAVLGMSVVLVNFF